MKKDFHRKVLAMPHANAVQPIQNFQRKILSNGMTIVFEKRDIPVVSVAFAVRNGGVNEAAEEKGISHFIEHMLYKGTPKRDAKKIAEEIEKNGGILNGFTGETLTAFWCKMPSKHLNVALEVLGDMVKNPLFDEKELEKERKVIFEEIKMCHDNPMRHVFDEIHKTLYEMPFGIPLIGTNETMSSLDKNKISKKFKEIYQPNNMILCVVGDADFEKIVKFAEENFVDGKGKIPKFDIKLKNELKIEKRKGIDQANLVFAFHIPLSTDKKNYAAQVLTTLMAGGMSSKLFSEIREKRNLAYAVKGDIDSSKDYAYAIVYVGTTKENVELVRKIILKEFENVARDLDEKELGEIKEQMIGNYQISMEDSQSQMVNLLLSEIDGDAENFYEFEKNISEVKLEDVKDLAKIESYSFFVLEPE